MVWISTTHLRRWYDEVTSSGPAREAYQRLVGVDWERFTLDYELLQQPLVALKRTRAHRARGSVELSSMEASINRKLRCRHGIHLGREIEKIRDLDKSRKQGGVLIA